MLPGASSMSLATHPVILNNLFSICAAANYQISEYFLCLRRGFSQLLVVVIFLFWTVQCMCSTTYEVILWHFSTTQLWFLRRIPIHFHWSFIEFQKTTFHGKNPPLEIAHRAFSFFTSLVHSHKYFHLSLLCPSMPCPPVCVAEPWHKALRLMQIIRTSFPHIFDWFFFVSFLFTKALLFPRGLGRRFSHTNCFLFHWEIYRALILNPCCSVLYFLWAATAGWSPASSQRRHLFFVCSSSNRIIACVCLGFRMHLARSHVSLLYTTPAVYGSKHHFIVIRVWYWILVYNYPPHMIRAKARVPRIQMQNNFLPCSLCSLCN